MRTTTAACLLTAAVAFAAIAQPALAEPNRPGDRMERIAEKLDLNEEQTGQVRQILSEQHEKRNAIIRGEGDRASKRAQMESLREETRARLATILNEEQLEQVDRFHARRDRAGPGRRDPGARLAEDLGLSGDQAEQVKRIMEEQREKHRTVMDSDAERREKHEQMQALHEETRARLATVLNEEQMARFDERHGMGPGRHARGGDAGGREFRRDRPRDGDGPRRRSAPEPEPETEMEPETEPGA